MGVNKIINSPVVNKLKICDLKICISYLVIDTVRTLKYASISIATPLSSLDALLNLSEFL